MLISLERPDFKMTEPFHLHLFTQLHSFESQILNCVYWKDISTTTKARDQLFSKSWYRKGISEIEKLQLDSGSKIPKNHIFRPESSLFSFKKYRYTEKWFLAQRRITIKQFFIPTSSKLYPAKSWVALLTPTSGWCYYSVHLWMYQTTVLCLFG